MKIIYADGREEVCETLWFRERDMLIDGKRIVPYIEVLRVVEKEKTGYN